MTTTDLASATGLVSAALLVTTVLVSPACFGVSAAGAATAPPGTGSSAVLVSTTGSAAAGQAAAGVTVIPDAPPGWRGIRLGSLGGGVSEIADGKRALNARGQVVGWSTTADGRRHAFLWDRRTGMIDLTPDAVMASASAVNDRGLVVGTVLAEDGTPSSFSWDARRGLRPLEVPYPLDVNNRGEVVGNDDCIWSPRHGRIPFGAPPGKDVMAYDVNDRSQVTGFSIGPPDYSRRAFFWDPRSGWHDLGPAAYGVNSEAFDLNSRGQVFGHSSPYASSRTAPFLWDLRHGFVQPDFGEPIGSAPGLTGTAEGINDRGDAVVWGGRVRDRRGAVREIVSDAGFVHAEAINARGTVVGEVTRNDWEEPGRAFVWTRRHGLVDLGPVDSPVMPGYDTVFLNDRDQVAFTSGDQVVLWTRG